MLIPAGQTLRTEDFPSEQKWIPRLLGPLNSFLLGVTSAMNGNVTLGDNIPCDTIVLSFTYNATSDFPKTSKWKVSSNALGSSVTPPVELRICSATEDGTPIALATPPWSYAPATQLISISYFTKLSSAGVSSSLVVGSTYKIVLRGQP